MTFLTTSKMVHSAPKPLDPAATIDTTDGDTVVGTATSAGFALETADIELKNKNLAVQGQFDETANTATLTTFVAPHLTQGRKWVLLSIFSLAMFIDIL